MPLTLTVSSTAWITLSELKAHANVSSADSDAELSLILEAAQDAVEGLVGPILWRTVTQTASVANSTVVLNTLPVLSVTSATLGGSAVTYTLAPGGLLTGVAVSGDVVVTYVVGRDSVPAAIQLATLIIAAHLWETQLGNAPSQLQPDDFSSGVVGLGYAIPNRAADLLAPYLLLPGLA